MPARYLDTGLPQGKPMSSMRHVTTTLCVEHLFSQAYFSINKNGRSRDRASRKNPVLYIFNNNGGIQIAWNATLPQTGQTVRQNRRDKSFSLLGFIRTLSAG